MYLSEELESTGTECNSKNLHLLYHRPRDQGHTFDVQGRRAGVSALLSCKSDSLTKAGQVRWQNGLLFLAFTHGEADRCLLQDYDNFLIHSFIRSFVRSFVPSFHSHEQ